jgi:pimeloyl-ACP methyl ester carboxylesterase
MKVHLIGHSFGGRLVTAAANALAGGSAGHQVATMLLLQAAYSHYGMAHDYQPNTDGMFRSIITGKKVTSEIQITHSVHDVAVGLAYPLASALAHQIGQAAFINPFGGMGADGARTTPEAFENTLGAVGTAYSKVAAPAIVRNLNGDAIIQGHSDVTHDEIAYAELLAVSRA